MVSLGIRNNNPGNIRKSAIRWQGLSPDQSDPNFCIFTDAVWGIRAIARDLLSYQSRDGCKTLAQVISRWAPASENQTDTYITQVAAAVHVDPNAEVDLDSCTMMLPVIRAIILRENGMNPYTDSQLLDGMRRAGVADVKPPALVAQTSFQTKVAAGGLLGGAGVVSTVADFGHKAAGYAPEIKKTADALQDYTSSPLIGHLVVFLVTVAGGLLLAGSVADWLKQRKEG